MINEYQSRFVLAAPARSWLDWALLFWWPEEKKETGLVTEWKEVVDGDWFDQAEDLDTDW